MKQDVKTFRFTFKATIGQFVLNAPNINSPIAATWKRSSQSVSTSIVDMVAGKANFNQTIELPLNMYYEQSKKQFQDKKTAFTFTMNTPKGEKQAGVAYVEVARILNNQLQSLSEYFMLEKCPVKDSKVHITITAEFIREENAPDNPSVPSVPSVVWDRSFIKTADSDQKDKTIDSLQTQVKALLRQKEELSRQLTRLRAAGKCEGGATEQGSKGLQQKLQAQLAEMRRQNSEHQRELQKMRIRMQQLYELLQAHFSG